MKTKKTFGIVVFFTAVILSAYLISASSVLGFLFYDATTGTSLTINDGENAGIIISADSIFENYMNVHVGLLNSGGSVVANLLDTNVIQDSYSNHITVGKSDYGSAGDYTIRLTVTGDSGQTDSYELSLVVSPLSPTNNLPIITSTPVTSVNENSTYSYDVNANDADGDTLTYSLTQKPSWLNINTNTGLITGTSPEVSQDTQFVATVEVSDGKGSVTQVFTIDVKNVLIPPPTNNAPVITSSPVTSVNENSTYSYDVNANDADGDVLTYSLTQRPIWLNINSQTGLIQGNSPVVSQDIDYSITVIVSDGIDVTPQSYTLVVKNVVVPPTNNAPQITSTPITSVNENANYNYQVVATDSDGDALTYSISGASWLSISSVGLISGSSPSVNADTPYSVSVSVNDGKVSTTANYVLTVLDVTIVTPPTGDTTAPVITITSPTSITYTTNNINVVVSTNEFATAWFSLDGGSNVNLNTANGFNFNYALTGLSDGNHNLVVYARDSSGNVGSASVLFTIDTSSSSGGSSGSSEKTHRVTTLVFDDYSGLNQNTNFVPLEEEPVVNVKTPGSAWGLILWILGILIFLILLFLLIVLLMRM